MSEGVPMEPGNGPAGPLMVGAAAFGTDLPGEPVTIEVLAESLARRVLPALDDAARVADEARGEVAAEWQGLFARRSLSALEELGRRARAARDRVADTVAGLRGYAERLRAAQGGLARLRHEAAAAGLLVAGGVVSAPPGRECDLVPFLERARELFRLADPADLSTPPAPPDALALLLLVPGASATVADGTRAEVAAGLRAQASSLEDPARARQLTSQADELVRKGRWFSRTATGVTTPLGVLLDRQSGESWVQAGTSQGAGLVAGSLAGAASAAALSSPTGPGALAVGAVAFGAGLVAGSAANSAVDARFAASRRGPGDELVHRCGAPGQRRRPPLQTKHGVAEGER